jgi:hypothetical protein
MGRIRATTAVTALGAALGLVLLAGCANPSSAGGGSGPGSAPGSEPSGSPSGTSAPPGAPTTSGLRGVKVASIQCAGTTWQPDDKTAVRLPSVPVRVVICPLPMPNAVHPPADLRPPPASLLSALAESDGPLPTASPYVCAAYADVPRLVYAQTADGAVYLLHIPVDACGHYLVNPMAAVNQYAKDGPISQSTS